MKPYRRLFYSRIRAGAVAAASFLLLASTPGHAQLTPDQINQFKNVVGDRVEAATILGGDYGVSGGTFNNVNNNANSANLNISKFGGMGDIGAPRQLGSLDIGWQPQLQGSMGYLTAKNNFKEGNLAGNSSEYKTFAIQFGGGARFWLSDQLSIAPTLMGMYGHTENDFQANTAFAQANLQQAKQLGLVNWNADTWTVLPGGNIQYQYPWRRVIFTASSGYTYYHTESFSSSSSLVSINGDSEAWENKIDVDIPLGVELFGHELRTGGYFSRTDLYGDLQSGLKTDYYYEVHPRLVLDFLDQLWKVQWIGVGGSYLWSSNFKGWSIGGDVAFRF